MEKNLLNGTCEFEIFEDTSNKNGKPYRALRLKFKDYTLKKYIFVNDDHIYIIKQKLGL